MYTLAYNIEDRAGTYEGNTVDEVFDRLCELMGNRYDNYDFDNKVVDMRYRVEGHSAVFERYEETCDITDHGLKVGHYIIKKVD